MQSTAPPLNSPPTFSVIVPVYNVEEYLPECLDSILAQSHQDFELLLVNDGSTDNSPTVAGQYARQDPRIRLLHQANAGLSAARNTALNHARGRYCLFVDADDIIHPQLLHICHYFLNKYQADLIGFDHARIHPHAGLQQTPLVPTRMRHHVSRTPLPLLAQRHRHRLSMMTPLSCCRTDISRRHPFEHGLLYEDYPRTTCLMRDISKAVSLRAPLYGYTIRPGSIMHTRFSAEHIAHYRRGLLCIAEAYQDDTTRLATVTRIVYPEILKQIGNLIFRSERKEEERTDMLRAFRALLCELAERGLLRWRGHKWRRYFAYRKLVRTDERQLGRLLPALARVFH